MKFCFFGQANNCDQQNILLFFMLLLILKNILEQFMENFKQMCHAKIIVKEIQINKI